MLKVVINTTIKIINGLQGCVDFLFNLFSFSRPKSKTASAPGSVTHTPVPTDPTMEMLHDRITLANAISALEDDAQDDNYTATVDDNVLPVGAEEMGSGL